MKYTKAIVGIIALMILTSLATTGTFFSKYGELVVDYFAFAAALFLIIEGLYFIKRNKNEKLNFRLFRITRILIGVCIITIHFWQFYQGF